MKEALTIESFKKIILIEEFFVFLFGIYVGGFIMTYLISRIFTKTKTIENKHFEKINYVEFINEEGKKTYFINSKNKSVFDVMRGIILIIFYPSILTKNYVVKNEKMAKIFITTLFVIGVFVTFLAIASMVRFPLPPVQR